MVRRFNTIAELYKDTQELIEIFMPDLDLETGPSTDALPEDLLPDIEPINDAYMKLAVLRYFRKSE